MRQEIIHRLSGLEKAHAVSEIFLGILNFGGDAPRLRGHDGRVWDRAPDEAATDFTKRIAAEYPPRGFLLLHAA